MTFSPDKSPKGNISGEREREREKLVSRSIFHHLVRKKKIQKSDEHRIDPSLPPSPPIDDVSPMFRTEKRPATILLFVSPRHSARNPRRIFRSERIFARLEKSWNGEEGGDGWKKHFAAMKENCKAIYFLWELRRVRGSIASKAFVTVTYLRTKRRERIRVPPRTTFRDNETYLTDTRAFFNAPTSTN